MGNLPSGVIPPDNCTLENLVHYLDRKPFIHELAAMTEMGNAANNPQPSDGATDAPPLAAPEADRSPAVPDIHPEIHWSVNGESVNGENDDPARPADCLMAGAGESGAGDAAAGLDDGDAAAAEPVNLGDRVRHSAQIDIGIDNGDRGGDSSHGGFWPAAIAGDSVAAPGGFFQPLVNDADALAASDLTDAEFDVDGDDLLAAVFEPVPRTDGAPDAAAEDAMPRDRSTPFSDLPLPNFPQTPEPTFHRRSSLEPHDLSPGDRDPVSLVTERAALKKRIAQLEEALEECRATLELQLLHAQAQDDLLTQQGDEMEAASSTVEGLLSELESLREDAERKIGEFRAEVDRLQEQNTEISARALELERLLEARTQESQRQQILTETLTRQLEASQARVAQLERACALLQQRNLDRATQLAQAEQLSQELRSRLHRQQRQTLQFRAALEQCLDLQGTHRPVPDAIDAEDLDLVTAELLDRAPEDESLDRDDAATNDGGTGIHPWTPADEPPIAAIAPTSRIELPPFGRNLRDFNGLGTSDLKAEEILALLDWQLDERGTPPTPCDDAEEHTTGADAIAPSPPAPAGIRLGVWDQLSSPAGSPVPAPVDPSAIDKSSNEAAFTTDLDVAVPGAVDSGHADNAPNFPADSAVAHIFASGAELLDVPEYVVDPLGARPRTAAADPNLQPLDLPASDAALAQGAPMSSAAASPVLFPSRPRKPRLSLAAVELPHLP